MSHVSKWQDILTHICLGEVQSLDDLLATMTPRSREGGGPVWLEVDVLSLSLPLKDGAPDAVGFRITETMHRIWQEKPGDLVIRAAMLTSMAIEHGVEIVVLSYVPYCGLERFGFRVERIVGNTPEAREACEGQVMAFWGIEVVV